MNRLTKQNQRREIGEHQPGEQGVTRYTPQPIYKEPRVRPWLSQIAILQLGVAAVIAFAFAGRDITLVLGVVGVLALCATIGQLVANTHGDAIGILVGVICVLLFLAADLETRLVYNAWFIGESLQRIARVGLGILGFFSVAFLFRRKQS